MSHGSAVTTLVQRVQNKDYWTKPFCLKNSCVSRVKTADGRQERKGNSESCTSLKLRCAQLCTFSVSLKVRFDITVGVLLMLRSFAGKAAASIHFCLFVEDWSQTTVSSTDTVSHGYFQIKNPNYSREANVFKALTFFSFVRVKCFTQLSLSLEAA